MHVPLIIMFELISMLLSKVWALILTLVEFYTIETGESFLGVIFYLYFYLPVLFKGKLSLGLNVLAYVFPVW